MSEIISSGLDGPAENIYRVTRIDRDAGRNSDQHFSDFQDQKKQGDAEAGEEQKENPGPAAAEIVDDVILSDLARKAIESKAADGSVQQPPAHIEIQPDEGKKPVGGMIDIKA